MDPHRDTQQVTFHGHEAPSYNTAGSNYSSQGPTAVQQTEMTPTVPAHHHQTNKSMAQPISSNTDTSSRRNSYQDDTILSKTTQLYAATPRSPFDSTMIRLSYVLGFLGFLVTAAWLIALLVTQGQTFSDNNYPAAWKRDYTLALLPYLYHLPFFFACLSFMFMAGKRNTTLSWFLLTTSNFVVALFWLILVVPFYIHIIFPENSVSSSCPDTVYDATGAVAADYTQLCRLRKGAAALSCALALVHALWFLIALVQTVRHWKTIIVLDAAYPSKQMWLLLIMVECAGLIVWAAGNLRLTALGKADIQTFSDPILNPSTYLLTLLAMVSIVMTAYAILDASKLYCGITMLFHLCTAMMYWGVFVWTARRSLNPHLDYGYNAPNVYFDDNAARVVAAGVGIIAGVETVFTLLFAIAYKMMPDLFLTQPNLTGPAAV